jgi:hypothetical protein
MFGSFIVNVRYKTIDEVEFHEVYRVEFTSIIQGRIKKGGERRKEGREGGSRRVEEKSRREEGEEEEGQT